MTKISKLPTANSVSANDYIIVLTNPTTHAETEKTLLSTLFSNVNIISVNNLIVANNYTPASNSVTMTKGTLFFSNTHLYVAISNNVLRRIALETF